jgi:hypothetical protein
MAPGAMAHLVTIIVMRIIMYTIFSTVLLVASVHAALNVDPEVRRFSKDIRCKHFLTGLVCHKLPDSAGWEQRDHPVQMWSEGGPSTHDCVARQCAMHVYCVS